MGYDGMYFISEQGMQFIYDDVITPTATAIAPCICWQTAGETCRATLHYVPESTDSIPVRNRHERRKDARIKRKTNFIKWTKAGKINIRS